MGANRAVIRRTQPKCNQEVLNEPLILLVENQRCRCNWQGRTPPPTISTHNKTLQQTRTSRATAS